MFRFAGLMAVTVPSVWLATYRTRPFGVRAQPRSSVPTLDFVYHRVFIWTGESNHRDSATDRIGNICLAVIRMDGHATRLLPTAISASLSVADLRH